MKPPSFLRAAVPSRALKQREQDTVRCHGDICARLMCFFGQWAAAAKSTESQPWNFVDGNDHGPLLVVHDDDLHARPRPTTGMWSFAPAPRSGIRWRGRCQRPKVAPPTEAHHESRRRGAGRPGGSPGESPCMSSRALAFLAAPSSPSSSSHAKPPGPSNSGWAISIPCHTSPDALAATYLETNGTRRRHLGCGSSSQLYASILRWSGARLHRRRRGLAQLRQQACQ